MSQSTPFQSPHHVCSEPFCSCTFATLRTRYIFWRLEKAYVGKMTGLMEGYGSHLDLYHHARIPYHPEVFRLRDEARILQKEYTYAQVKLQYWNQHVFEANRDWKQACNPTLQQEKDVRARLVTHYMSFLYANSGVLIPYDTILIPVFEYTPPSMLGWRLHSDNLIRGCRWLFPNGMFRALGWITRKSVDASVQVAAAMESFYAAQRHEVKHMASSEQAILAQLGTTEAPLHLVRVRCAGYMIVVVRNLQGSRTYY